MIDPYDSRHLCDIAREIVEDWGSKMSPYATPYVEAMGRLRLITDSYYEDSAESVVRYFLANAGG